MKGFLRVGISVYLAVICMIVLNLIFGTGGAVEYHEMNEYKKTIQANIWDLNDINSNLVIDSDKFMHQSDDVKIQARELGWFEPNEGIVVIKGYKHSNSGYAMGKMMSHDKNRAVNSHSSLLIAIFTGLSFFIFTGFFSNYRYRK